MIINVFISLEYEREVNMKTHHDRNETNQGRYTRTRHEFSLKRLAFFHCRNLTQDILTQLCLLRMNYALKNRR